MYATFSTFLDDTSADAQTVIIGGVKTQQVKLWDVRTRKALYELSAVIIKVRVLHGMNTIRRCSQIRSVGEQLLFNGI
jgi:hypothetical protein